MEKELYGILRKHKLPLKKREEMMVDLLNLFIPSNNEGVVCNCPKGKYKLYLDVINDKYMCQHCHKQITN